MRVFTHLYINRFLSPDTIVPEKGDSQALNRYAYARNNPLLIVDETGHCWGIASGMRNWNVTVGGTSYGMGTNCANIDMALTIVQHPDATPTQKAQAGAYLGGWGAATVSGAAGTGLLICSTAAPCAAAANATLGLGTAASADGNPFNEINMMATTGQNVWKLNPFKRGLAIENFLGRSKNLVSNFPVIDRFKNGTATSIKSMDLSAKSYQTINTLNRTVQGYVNKLAQWNGATWGQTTIRASDITSRQVILAVPPNATQAQMDALIQLQQWATTQGVTLSVVVIK